MTQKKLQYIDQCYKQLNYCKSLLIKLIVIHKPFVNSSATFFIEKYNSIATHTKAVKRLNDDTYVLNKSTKGTALIFFEFFIV